MPEWFHTRQGQKKKILRVSPAIISKYGVVSDKTAKEMAEKLRVMTKTDYSLSTTGNLGPEVLEGKEKGLIYIAVSRKGETFLKVLRLKGSREKNKEVAALEALKYLLGALNK
jgi:PncC family amidohydrolase